MNGAAETVRLAVSEFVSSCDRDYAFPAGGNLDVLTTSEEKLQQALQSERLSDAEKMSQLSSGLEWNECYSLVIFGIRMAVLAVRDKRPRFYKLGVLALIAGMSQIDRRDLLRAFSIFEDCGKRLGIRFQDELMRFSNAPDEGSLKSTIENYFNRPEEMRSIEVMGVVEYSTDKGFMFKSA